MPDMFKLDAAMDYLRAHPEQHDQRYWGRQTPCGTTMCLAGTVAHLAGHEFYWENYGNDIKKAGLCFRPAEDELSYTVIGGSSVAFIASLAQRELGITEAQANELFYKAETLEDLEHAVKDIANEQSWDKC